MTATTKETRRARWRRFSFAGSIDWALDLQSFTADDPEKDEPDPLTLDPDYLRINGASDPFIQDCRDLQAQRIRQAWKDAGLIATAHAKCMSWVI